MDAGFPRVAGLHTGLTSPTLCTRWTERPLPGLVENGWAGRGRDAFRAGSSLPSGGCGDLSFDRGVEIRSLDSHCLGSSKNADDRSPPAETLPEVVWGSPWALSC